MLLWPGYENITTRRPGFLLSFQNGLRELCWRQWQWAGCPVSGWGPLHVAAPRQRQTTKAVYRVGSYITKGLSERFTACLLSTGTARLPQQPWHRIVMDTVEWWRHVHCCCILNNNDRIDLLLLALPCLPLSVCSDSTNREPPDIIFTKFSRF